MVYRIHPILTFIFYISGLIGPVLVSASENSSENFSKSGDSQENTPLEDHNSALLVGKVEKVLNPKAINPATGFLVFPDGCIEDCVYQALEDGSTFTNTQYFVSFVNGAIASVKESFVEFVKGRVLIEAKHEGSQVRSEFGTFTFSSQGQAIFVRNNDRVEVYPLTTALKMLPKGSATEVIVEPGTTNWLSRVGKNGVAESGFPQTANFKAVTKKWGQLFTGDIKDFKLQLAEYTKKWSAQLGEASDLQKEYIERKLSAIEEQKIQRARQKLRARQEREKLENMFLQRNNFQY